MSTEVTKEIPIKENIAIAAFMGKTVYPIKGTKQFKKWKGEACNYQWFDLKYHEDWNVLRAVIDKISTYAIAYPEQVKKVIDMKIVVYIGAAHKAVYDFITWYNTTKQG